MTPSGLGGGEAASFRRDGGGAPPARRLWQITAIRGAIAVVLGSLPSPPEATGPRW